MLRRVGLREVVDFACGDATEIVAGLPGPFDCVFFDADRYSAPAQLSLLMPKLTPDVLLLADNVLSHPTEIAAYLRALEALPGFDRRDDRSHAEHGTAACRCFDPHIHASLESAAKTVGSRNFVGQRSAFRQTPDRGVGQGRVSGRRQRTL